MTELSSAVPALVETVAIDRSRPWAASRSFVRHLVEMTVAMIIGMIALAPIWDFAFSRLNWTSLGQRPALNAIVMATNMTIAMTAWMRFRGHRWAVTAEMAAAMYVPFLLLLIPHQLGLISGTGLMMLGHLLMIPAMITAMLCRKNEYTHNHHAVLTPDSAPE
jgi:hypothetical protein